VTFISESRVARRKGQQVKAGWYNQSGRRKKKKMLLERYPGASKSKWVL
jgi:hypothetical protein